MRETESNKKVEGTITGGYIRRGGFEGDDGVSEEAWENHVAISLNRAKV